MDTFGLIVTSLGGTVAILGFAYYLIKQLVEFRLSKEIEKHKSQLGDEAERLKSDLRLVTEAALNDRKLVNSQLYIRQIKALESLYPALKRLNDIVDSINQDTRPIYGGQDISEIQNRESVLYSDNLTKFYNLYTDFRIFLPIEMNNKIDSYLDATYKVVHYRQLMSVYAKDEVMRFSIPSLSERANHLGEKEIKPLLSDMESEMRVLLKLLPLFAEIA